MTGRGRPRELSKRWFRLFPNLGREPWLLY